MIITFPKNLTSPSIFHKSHQIIYAIQLRCWFIVFFKAIKEPLQMYVFQTPFFGNINYFHWRSMSIMLLMLPMFGAILTTK